MKQNKKSTPRFYTKLDTSQHSVRNANASKAGTVLAIYNIYSNIYSIYNLYINYCIFSIRKNTLYLNNYYVMRGLA